MNRKVLNIGDGKSVLVHCRRVLKKYDVDFDPRELRSSTRRSGLVYVRALIAYYLRSKDYSLEEIGIVLNRNHATVINLLRYGTKKQGRNQDYSLMIQCLGITAESSVEARIKFHEEQIEKLRTGQNNYSSQNILANGSIPATMA